jgi:hypothetical protein
VRIVREAMAEGKANRQFKLVKLDAFGLRPRS